MVYGDGHTEEEATEGRKIRMDFLEEVILPWSLRASWPQSCRREGGLFYSTEPSSVHM